MNRNTRNPYQPVGGSLWDNWIKYLWLKRPYLTPSGVRLISILQPPALQPGLIIFIHHPVDQLVKFFRIHFS
ncbi:MAG: hypothetical protein WD028_02615, partial [Balneolaceae bacterium]